MGSEPPTYLVIHELIFLQNFVYFIFFAWSKIGLVKKILKRLGKAAWFQYKTVPQKNKDVSQKNQNKNFVKKRITKYFGGSDPMNELMTWYSFNLSSFFTNLRNLKTAINKCKTCLEGFQYSKTILALILLWIKVQIITGHVTFKTCYDFWKSRPKQPCIIVHIQKYI